MTLTIRLSSVTEDFPNSQVLHIFVCIHPLLLVKNEKYVIIALILPAYTSIDKITQPTN